MANINSPIDTPLSVRSATSQDFEKVLEISEGIYEGGDYLPIVFHHLLKQKRRHVLLGELQGNPIGLQIATISQNGQYFFTQALRLHPKYRGQKLSYKLVTAVITYVRSKFPNVSTKYFVCFKTVPAAITIAERFGAKVLMEQKFFIIEGINPKEVNLNIDLSTLGLVAYDKQDSIKMLKDVKILDLIKRNFIVAVYEVYKLPEDSDDVVKEVDLVLVDDTPRQGEFPKSFSHGQWSKRVSKTFWTCNIFTDSPELFKKHIRCQLNFVTKNVVGDFEFQIFQGSSPAFDGLQVLKDELLDLRLKTEIKSDRQVLFEQLLDMK